MMLETDNLEAIRSTINELPMVQNKILDIEILPLIPYTGLKELFVK